MSTPDIPRLLNAQARWSQVPLKERAAILLRLHDLVLDRQDELMDAIQADTHKNRRSAFEEVMDVAITARYYAHRGPTLLRPRRARGALPLLTRTEVSREPLGVVGIISPWNYPLTLTLSEMLPALMAGNAILLKPDELGMRTARLGIALLSEIGIPRDLIQVLEGGAEAGTAVANNASFLMFTGSTRTARKVAETTGPRLIGLSAELGGKNPMIISEDADIELAAHQAINACFSNSGQLCVSIERILLHHSIAAEFQDRFLTHIKNMKIGPGPGWDIDMGGLVTPAHLQHVDAFVRDALDQGAELLCGGHTLPDLGDTFYAPTVLRHVPESAKLYRNEVFGPVVYLETFRTQAEAITRANDSDFGLNASVFASPSTAWSIAKQLHSGSVNINEGYAATWASIDAPHGGWKDSGLGGRHGASGLLQYTRPRTIAQQRGLALGDGLPPATMSTLLKLGKHFLR